MVSIVSRVSMLPSPFVQAPAVPNQIRIAYRSVVVNFSGSNHGQEGSQNGVQDGKKARSSGACPRQVGRLYGAGDARDRAGGRRNLRGAEGGASDHRGI